jgi:hypothetical protein
MKPERMKSWIVARPTGATRLQLLHDGGLGSHTPVMSWSVADIENMDSPTSPDATVNAVEEAAREHATSEGEPCSYLLQWQAKNGVAIKSVGHKAAPDVDADGAPGVKLPDAMNANRIVTELLGHISMQQKTMQQGMVGVLAAYEKALAMQQKVIDSLAVRVAELPPPQLAAGDNEEVQRLKMIAFQKLIDIGPDVLNLGIHAIAKSAGMIPAAAPAPEVVLNGAGA